MCGESPSAMPETDWQGEDSRRRSRRGRGAPSARRGGSCKPAAPVGEKDMAAVVGAADKKHDAGAQPFDPRGMVGARRNGCMFICG
jgi:hypothetical protein